MYKCILSLVTYHHSTASLLPLLHSINTFSADCSYSVHLRVLDNSLSELSYDNLRSILSDNINLSFYRSPSNIGFGSGHNYNLLSVSSDHDSCFIIVNPDISFKGYEVSALVHWFRSNLDYSCVSPLMLQPNGHIQFTAKSNPSILSLFLGFTGLYKFRFLPFFQYYESHCNQHLDYTTDIIHCTYLSGAFLLIRPSSFQAISGFDPQYFLHLEDADIVRSLSQLGKTAHLPWFRVYHVWARGSHKSLRQIYCVIVSLILYFRKWGLKIY